MNDPNDPAYPMQRVTGLHTGNPISGHPGMTIRQDFVKAAMQGLCANPALTDDPVVEKWVAAVAVRFADAALAEEARTRSKA